MVVHIVVGAGASGCMAAIKLLQAGHDVVLVERGPFGAWAADGRQGEGTTQPSDRLHSTPISWGDAAYCASSPRSVQHATAPQPQLAGRTVAYPQGRGAGGTLAVNAMIWSAGHRAVFDAGWPLDWGSDVIDRLLREVREICLPQPIVAGGHVDDLLAAIEDSRSGCRDEVPASDGIWEDGVQARRRYLSTTDGRGQRTQAIDWVRAAATEEGAGGLYVLSNTVVDRVLLEGGGEAGSRAVGLLVRSDGGESAVLPLPQPGSEILLCAGSLESPRVLMASVRSAFRVERGLTAPAGPWPLRGVGVARGVADAVEAGVAVPCKERGPPCASNVRLCGVGDRLQDHSLLPIFFLNMTNLWAMLLNLFVWAVNILPVDDSWKPKYFPMAASGRGVETALNGVHGWVNAGDQPPPGVRPLKILFLDGRVAVSMGDQLLPRLEAREGSWARPAMAMRSALTAGIGVILRLSVVEYVLCYGVVVALVSLVQPLSEGKVQEETPQLDPAYLKCPEDRSQLHRGLAICRRMVAAAMASDRCPYLVEAVPGPLVWYGASEWATGVYSSVYSTSFFHMTGSCRMPSQNDPTGGTVDSCLRVRGIARLRVADCSVFPAMPSAPTAAVAMAVGRRAAELLADYAARTTPLCDES